MKITMPTHTRRKVSVDQLIVDLAGLYVEAEEKGGLIAAVEARMMSRIPQLDTPDISEQKRHQRRAAFLSDCADLEARLAELHRIGRDADKIVDRLGKDGGWQIALARLGPQALHGSVEVKRRYHEQSAFWGSWDIAVACERCGWGRKAA